MSLRGPVAIACALWCLVALAGPLSAEGATDLTVPALTPETFQNAIHSVDYAVVDFFQPRCPHCKRFAPKFFTASEFFKNDDSVKLWKVDCDAYYKEICDQFPIEGFPTVFLFSPKIANGTDMFEGVTEADAVVQWINKHKTAAETEPRKLEREPSRSMLRTRGDTMETRIELPKKKKEGVPPPKDVAAATAAAEKEAMEVAAAEAEVDQAEEGGNESEVEQKLAHLNELDAQFQDAMNTLNSMQGAAPAGAAMGLMPRPEWGSTRPLMADLKSTIQLSFANDVFNKKALRRAEARSAFNNFLQLLSNAFPGEMCRTSFTALQTKMKGFTEEEIVTADADELAEIWRLCAEEWRPPQYAHCLGSSPEYRGFTCGLWVTFHTLMAHSTDASALANVAAVRAYVLNFFGCRECTQHFAAMSEKLDEKVANQYDAVMWFWNAHNLVNDRLESDSLNDPNFPKVQYPPEYLCPQCWKQGSEGMVWDEAQVYDFLQRHYCRDFENPKCAKYSKDPIMGVNRNINHYRYTRQNQASYQAKDKVIMALVLIATGAVCTLGFLAIKLRNISLAPDQGTAHLYR